MYTIRRKFRSQNFRQYGQMEEKRCEESRGRRKEVRRKKRQVHEKVGKSLFTLVFPMISGSGGLESRLAKAAGAEPCGQMRDPKLYTVVARSTFRSQNVQDTPGSDHFLKLRFRKQCASEHF